MIGKNIRYLRNAHGMPQSKLAEEVGGVTCATNSQWEAERYVPRGKRLDALTRIFNVSIDDLLYTDLERRAHEKASGNFSGNGTVRINVYSKIHAGFPSEATDEIVDWEDIRKEMTSGGREYFGLKVYGNCMYPKYQEGDTIIVRKQPDCESGQDCVVYVDGYDAELRKVIKKANSVILQPLNPEYEPQIYYRAEDFPVTICGVVVEIRRKV